MFSKFKILQAITWLFILTGCSFHIEKNEIPKPLEIVNYQANLENTEFNRVFRNFLQKQGISVTNNLTPNILQIKLTKLENNTDLASTFIDYSSAEQIITITATFMILIPEKGEFTIKEIAQTSILNNGMLFSQNDKKRLINKILYQQLSKKVFQQIKLLFK